jgi:hypothetical protein
MPSLHNLAHDIVFDLGELGIRLTFVKETSIWRTGRGS